MKTFKQLNIKDEIYILNTSPSHFLKHKDYYGNVFPEDVFKTITVNSIILEDKLIKINKDTNTYKPKLSITDIPISKQNMSNYRLDRQIIISDKRLLKKVLRTILVEEIVKTEQKTRDIIKSNNQYIQDLRNNYFHTLN